MPAQIAIERLKPCTRIHRADDFDFGPFGSFAEVQSVEFDGYGYTVTAVIVEGTYGTVTDTEVQFIVDAGQSVAFGGLGEPSLRAEDDVTDEEWEAKGEAISADIDRIQGLLNEFHGHVCREIDERPLMAAVADVLGVHDLQSEAA